MITIYSLIFQSCDYADWIWNSVHKNTPEIEEGKAKFVIMLNNPTEEVEKHVKNKGYNWQLNISPPITEEEMNQKGLAGPTYLNSVYAAYNLCLKSCETEYACLLNSDMFPSFGWLQGLLKYANDKTIVTSALVEPPRENNDIFINFITKRKVMALNAGFGLKDFDELKFTEFIKKVDKTGVEPLISYQPILIHKNISAIGVYPEGNVLADNPNRIFKYKGGWVEYGDMYFIRKMRSKGIACIQSNESIVYHFDNGERLNK